jgi:hypothetical protein
MAWSYANITYVLVDLEKCRVVTWYFATTSHNSVDHVNATVMYRSIIIATLEKSKHQHKVNSRENILPQVVFLLLRAETQLAVG